MQATTTAAQTTIAVVINWGYWIFSPLISIHQWTSYMLARWSGVFKMVSAAFRPVYELVLSVEPLLSRAYRSLITPLGIMVPYLNRMYTSLLFFFNFNDKFMRSLDKIPNFIGTLPATILDFIKRRIVPEYCYENRWFSRPEVVPKEILDARLAGAPPTPGVIVPPPITHFIAQATPSRMNTIAQTALPETPETPHPSF